MAFWPAPLFTTLDVFDVLAASLAKYRIFYSPAKLTNLVDGVKKGMTRDSFDRKQGAVLQPDGSGNLEVWTEPSGKASATAAATRGRAKSAPKAKTKGKGWKRLGLARALALGVPGSIDLLPQTALSWSAARGAATLRIASLAQLGLSKKNAASSSATGS